MLNSFDLTTEPWIRVRMLNGEVIELSLLRTFDQAHEIRALAGELPTQDVAVLRLLLAIFRRTHPHAVGPNAWRDLWDRERFDAAPMTRYLEQYRERFDLLHPETPFYQVADLRTSKGEMKPVVLLLPDVPFGENAKEHFSTRSRLQTEQLDLSEAARWVVYTHAFDISGIKSGALGDPRVNLGKTSPMGTGWCAKLGVVVAEGDNLFQTLLLSCPLDPITSQDRPVWERRAQTAAPAEREWPDGPLDLLTWQSRRIRIEHDGEHATAVLVANGDPLPPVNRFGEEPMSSWRYSEQQTKAIGTGLPAFIPRTHPKDRSIWRGLAGLLAEGQAGDDARLLKTGRWQTWLAELRRADALPRERIVKLRAVGMHFDSKYSRIEDVIDDVLNLPISVLAVPTLKTLAVNAVRDADAVAQAMGTLNLELAEAAGLSGDRVRDVAAVAREQTYAALERPYRDWLSSLTEDTTAEDGRSDWQRTALRVAMPVSRDLIDRAGQAAWIGREVSRGPDRTVYLDAALAELGLRRRLRMALPDAYLNGNSQGDAA